MVMKFKVTDFRKDPLSEHRIEITCEEVGLFCCCNALFLIEFGLMEKLNTVRKERAKKTNRKFTHDKRTDLYAYTTTVDTPVRITPLFILNKCFHLFTYIN